MDVPPSLPAGEPGSVSPRRSKSGSALAVTSLVLGILGVVTSFLLAGIFLALAGLIFGALHLVTRREGRRMAWFGVGLSAAGILATLGFAVVYLAALQRERDPLRREAVQQYDGWIGQPAPDFEILTVDGETWKLSDQRGRRVVVDLWATWCAPCVQEVPHFVELRRTSGTNDLAMIGLSAEDRVVLKPFAAAYGMNYPVASTIGVELPQPFAGGGGLPTTFIVDREGRIERVETGYRDLAALRSAALGNGSREGTGADEGKPRLEGH